MRSGQSVNGICRRFPPVVAIGDDPRLPAVDGSDACGEFRDRETLESLTEMLGPAYTIARLKARVAELEANETLSELILSGMKRNAPDGRLRWTFHGGHRRWYAKSETGADWSIRLDDENDFRIARVSDDFWWSDLFPTFEAAKKRCQELEDEAKAGAS
jgi:hypothetical protein